MPASLRFASFVFWPKWEVQFIKEPRSCQERLACNPFCLKEFIKLKSNPSVEYFPWKSFFFFLPKQYMKIKAIGAFIKNTPSTLQSTRLTVSPWHKTFIIVVARDISQGHLLWTRDVDLFFA